MIVERICVWNRGGGGQTIMIWKQIQYVVHVHHANREATQFSPMAAFTPFTLPLLWFLPVPILHFHVTPSLKLV